MLKEIEKQYLYNSTEQLVQDLQRKGMEDYQNTPSNLTHVKEAARRNVVFFTVACKSLNDSIQCQVMQKRTLLSTCKK